MREILFFAYVGVLTASAIASAIFYRDIRTRRLGIMLPYLAYVSVQELALYFYSSPEMNSVIYNLYRPLTVIFFAMIYYPIPLMKPFRKVILYSAIFYVVLTIINYAFIEPIDQSSRYIQLIRGFIVCFYGIFFLFGYFLLDNHEEVEYWKPLMWVTIGIVIFYPVTSIIAQLHIYLYENAATLGGLKLYTLIPQLMSIFMYGCFTYAFYLCRKKVQISLYPS